MAATPNRNNSPLTPAPPEAGDPGEQRAYVGEHDERSHEPQGGQAERHDDRWPTQGVHAVPEAHDRRAFDIRQERPDSQQGDHAQDRHHHEGHPPARVGADDRQTPRESRLRTRS